MDEIDVPVSFNEWLKQRRKALDLTQVELALRASCSVPTLRKIEAGERRPSKQLAGLLARSLEVPAEEQTTFIKVARGELNLERLASPAQQPAGRAGQPQIPSQSHGNIPGVLTSFIGREPELASISQLLCDPQCRLLTIAGTGGIGKTRLAIEVAHRSQDLFPDGIWFVPLAPLSSSEYLLAAIADALNFRFQDSARPREQLFQSLQRKRAMLLLDNAEHLLDGVGIFGEILEACPQVKLLVTSRERLNLLSEWVFEIQGLPVPPNDQAEQFEEYSAAALFLQSARRSQPGFTVGEAERPWVGRICQLVEGLPLGIELAAAWVRMLSCEEIAREIERNLDFLTVSMRDIPERHRSLRATLDHSWNLLNPEEKAILSRLSVFRGSFRREAAQEVCGASLAVLSSLKNKSLLRRTERGYYDLHEFIQQYAALRLVEDTREEERLKDQHAIYYAQRLSEWEQALKSSRQVETLAEMVDEIDNLRQAWQRMVICCDFDCHRNTLFNPSLFQSSLFSLSLFYEMRCRNWEAIDIFRESVERLKAGCEASPSAEGNQRFVTVLGHITAYLGLHHYHITQFQQACELLGEALRLLDHPEGESPKAQAQAMMGSMYRALGELQNSMDLLKKSREFFEKEGNQWWSALSVSLLAQTYLFRGSTQEGIKLYHESLLRVESGDLRLGVPIWNGLGFASYLEGDYSHAEQLLVKSLDLSLKLGNQRQTGYCYRVLGQVYLAKGQIEQAEKHLHKCVELLKDLEESPELAIGLLYLGKCMAARRDMHLARDLFEKAIRIGQALHIFYLVYWGLVNLARVSMEEGHPGQALEMALVLQRHTVEPKLVQDDYAQLRQDLLPRLSPSQVEDAISRTQGVTIESLLDDK